jgi:hypothetical protein
MERASGMAGRIAARFIPALRRPATCSACGRMAAEVAHMIAGPHVYLCDGCVGQAARQLSLRQPPPEGVRCRFCGQPRAKDAVTAVGSVTVCADCLGLMESILAEAPRDLDLPHNER